MIDRTPDDKLRWAFKMYDEDNSREVDMQEMENVMVVSFFQMIRMVRMVKTVYNTIFWWVGFWECVVLKKLTW